MNESENPYQAPVAEETPQTRPLIPRLALAFFALLLLVRGLMMAFSFALYLPDAFLSGSFMFALFIKDGIYGVTALLGASLLFVHSRPGWYAALFHWLWYIACEVIVTLVAVSLSWKFPLGLGTTQYVTTTVLGVLGILVLLWKPTMASCGVDFRGAKRIIALSLLAVLLAFTLNWLALSRLW